MIKSVFVRLHLLIAKFENPNLYLNVDIKDYY